MKPHTAGTPARIVITTLGSFGDVNPYVGLALELRARGHRPVIVTSPYYREYIERAGVDFRPMRPEVDPTDRAMAARIMDPARGTDVLVREVLMPALRDAYDDLSAAITDADMLVTHPITFAGPVLAEERGLRWVSTVLAPMSFFSRHDLPVFPPIPWARRLGQVPGVARALVGLTRAGTRAWTDPVRRLRAERGLPAGGNALLEGQHSPDLVLALFSRLLGEPQEDWPRAVRITGPILYNGPTGAGLQPELEHFLRAGPPPVVFTLGSSAVHAAGTFYEQSAEAARRAGVRAVLLLGDAPRNRPAGPPPEGVIAVEHAPHAALLPRAAATVHQGGIGTLHQALRAGRPMLVVPHAHDQPDNAYRAARLGVARVVAPRRYSADRVADELRRLLGDPRYADRARSVAARLGEEDGVAAACDAIEARLARPAPRRETRTEPER